MSTALSERSGCRRVFFSRVSVCFFHDFPEVETYYRKKYFQVFKNRVYMVVCPDRLEHTALIDSKLPNPDSALRTPDSP
jgi:hypothetical protein